VSATPGVDTPGDEPAPAPSPAPPVETKPLNAIALAQEVLLERTQNLLEWLLRRLKRYRARRGEWWSSSPRVTPSTVQGRGMSSRT